MPEQTSDDVTNRAVQLHSTGKNIQEISRLLRKRPSTISDLLRSKGINTKSYKGLREPPNKLPTNPRVVEMFNSGVSINCISRQLEISRPVVNRMLIENGVTPRTRTEALQLRMQRTPFDARQSLAKAAQARRSEQREAQFKSGRLAKLSGWLKEMGLNPVLRTQAGTAKIDIACYPIAVEVVVGYTRDANPTQRLKLLTTNGWTVLTVFARTAVEIKIDVAHQIKNLYQCVVEDRSMQGEARVYHCYHKQLA